MNPIVGRLYDKIGPRVLVMAGTLLLLVNTWQFSKLKADTSITSILVLLAVRGIAVSMTMQPTFTTALGVIPRPIVPRGSSLVNSTRFVAQAIGVALLATVFASTISTAAKDLQQQVQDASPSVSSQFGICETLGTADGPPTSLAPAAQAGVQQACTENLSGLERAYKLTFFGALVAFAIAVFLPGWPRRWAGSGALGAPKGEKAPAASPS
jgi:MFS transporter, DHA2 family, multidrug resistance protein